MYYYIGSCLTYIKVPNPFSF